MSSNETLLQQARQWFRLAADAKEPEQVEMFSEMGRRYLTMAHRDAEITAKTVGA